MQFKWEVDSEVEGARLGLLKVKKVKHGYSISTIPYISSRNIQFMEDEAVMGSMVKKLNKTAKEMFENYQ